MSESRGSEGSLSIPRRPPASRRERDAARTAAQAGSAASDGCCNPIRLVLVANHPLICEAIGSHIHHEPGIEVTGVVGTAEAALAAGAQRPPHVVLVLLPGQEGIEATQQVAVRWPKVAVIVLSVDSRAELVVEALRAGATSYLTADCSVQLLCQAIRVSTEGGMLFASQPVRAAFRRLGLLGDGPSWSQPAPASRGALVAHLTARELEVLQLLADGCSNKEICMRLHLALATVKKHVQSVTGKLGVSDRTQAAVRGMREGLVR